MTDFIIITATSVMDSTVSGTATVSLMDAAVTGVTVTPQNAYAVQRHRQLYKTPSSFMEPHKYQRLASNRGNIFSQRHNDDDGWAARESIGNGGGTVRFRELQSPSGFRDFTTL
ncbi:MAG: hypothetical protein LBU70_05785 [Chitinispirillales bacterium]|nr:hypothetical protein [Chitinispirillales bacterium]